MITNTVVIVKKYFELGGKVVPIGTIGVLEEYKNRYELHALNDTWSWMKNDRQSDWVCSTYQIIDVNNKYIKMVLS